MRLLVVFLLLSPVIGKVYIDRMNLDFNEKVSNWSIVHHEDSTGNAVVNVTFQLFQTVNRALLYVIAKAAKDRHDKDCQIELLNTVVDAQKTLTGKQGNLLVRKFLDDLLKSMSFEPKFPLPPVSNCGFQIKIYP